METLPTNSGRLGIIRRMTVYVAYSDETWAVGCVVRRKDTAWVGHSEIRDRFRNIALNSPQKRQNRVPGASMAARPIRCHTTQQCSHFLFLRPKSGKVALWKEATPPLGSDVGTATEPRNCCAW